LFRGPTLRSHAPNSVVQLYFVEKQEGASRFREVKINQYGVILDWPDGFFDQSQREAEATLKAGFAKKQHERSQASP
jgi:predicted ATPase